jgi:hypothetical protein
MERAKLCVRIADHPLERWSADASAFLVVATSVGDPLIAAEWKKSRPWSNAMTTITTPRNRSTD